ncbi:acyl-CoA dehydrogenase family protein [Gordonia sp. ABSL1-1]|uniref:acyl-CoA dehydrogenase family protein n=1 Tax=Gordonia sp. ABSL1-1 TaxID=3053923 RepID=UPI002573F39A|nr:acyl-CoA dehydrogenase family protein [Gordonia sp. ABSL1-1]MDL9938072.1 acyl-CoA dehydrogenase family protein [Gordonia sp. ABSL1-1]
MQYGTTSELDGFRAQVRDFVQQNAPGIEPKAGVRSAEDREELALLKGWTRTLFAAGYIGGSWPREYGGNGPDHLFERDVVVGEEIARHRAPAPVQGAANLVAAALIDFGTSEQQAAYLPGIRSGEYIFCQLFSEPGSGSDLASLRTRATRLPDGRFRISGQKVWTTNGQWADFGYLLARTDPDAPKHKGISAFLIDMTLAGVDVRPLREMTGTADFNEVFLDDVVVGPEALIGELNGGWRIANSSLGHERSAVASSAVRVRRNIEDLVDLARRVQRDGRPAIEDPTIADRLGDLSAQAHALSALVYASLTRVSRGQPGVSDAPMTKLMFSELGVEVAAFALDLCGESGIVVGSDQHAVDRGRWQDEFLYARAYTIAGGSSEIMRNLIAERGLGLPR